MSNENLDFFKSLVKDIGNEYAGLISEFDDNVGFIDTGSYSLNALLSGSIYGGIPDNTVTALAGEPSTGKTFYAISIMKNFLKENPNNFVFFFESENAVNKKVLENRGVDVERVFLIPVETVEEFRTEATKILDGYLESKNKSRMMFVLDSLGNLSTQKEVEDIASGSAKRDMTRAQLIRGAFRVLTLKLGKAKVPLLCTNHVYEVVGSYVPLKKMGGGCLVKGTKIQTNQGIKSIEDIKKGDMVSTIFGERMVNKTFEFIDKEVYEIEFDDGTTIKCSEDHKFLVDGKWLSVFEMLDQAKNMNDINISISDTKGDVDVYKEQIYKNILETYGEGNTA